MIVAVSRFKADGAVASLEARFRSRPRLVDRHEGFLGIEVLRTTGQDPMFMLVTRWTGRAALKKYMLSSDFRAAHHDKQEENADFAIYEVVTSG